MPGTDETLLNTTPRYELKALDLDINDTFLFHADRQVRFKPGDLSLRKNVTRAEVV